MVVPGLLRNVLFLWIVAGALAVLGVLGWCHNPAESAIPPAVQKELDALKAEKKNYEARIAALEARSDSGTHRADSSVLRANTAIGASRVSRAAADSLAKLARLATTATQTAVLWQSAYEARTKEADSLRIATVRLDSAQKDRERARAAIQEQYQLADARRIQAEALNAKMEAAIKKAERGCRFLFIPCPSRTVVATVSFVAGAGSVLVLRP